MGEKEERKRLLKKTEEFLRNPSGEKMESVHNQYVRWMRKATANKGGR